MGSNDCSPAQTHSTTTTTNPAATTLYTETQEKGVLSSRGEGRTRFLGSSSGVHFLQNVRQVFLTTDCDSGLTLDEQSLLEEDDEDASGGGGGVGANNTVLNEPVPDVTSDIAHTLILPYFRYFHPLFPFLDGKLVRADVNRICNGKSLPIDRMIVLKSVFSIGLMDHPELNAKVDSLCFKSAAHASSYAHVISGKYDMSTIQSLLAIQVYLFARMFLQSSYELSGLIRSKIHLAGLHRCPARYAQLSEQSCVIRKRIYWSAYSIDRQLSQSLGLPFGYQDSDVDVCPLDLEQHMVGVDLPLAGPPHSQTFANNSQMMVAIYYGQYGRILGKVIGMFNRAIHSRQIDRLSVLELKSEIESWQNQLPSGLIIDSDRFNADLPFENKCFFNAIYCHLHILTHRPRLSLDPSNPEFKYAIQVCIDSSRKILVDLTWQCTNYPNQSLFWPGYLSMVWMSGLLIAYASRIGYYPVEKAREELALGIPLCQSMARRWRVARRCESMLRTLYDAIQTNNNSPINPNKRPREEEEAEASEGFNFNFETVSLDEFNSGVDDVFELFKSSLMWKDSTATEFCT